jgi:hypothetical protein
VTVYQPVYASLDGEINRSYLNQEPAIDTLATGNNAQKENFCRFLPFWAKKIEKSFAQ